jgi:amino acid adenylation domain-containing protein
MTTQGGPESQGWWTGPDLAPPVPTLDRILTPALFAAPDAEALVVRAEDGSTRRWTYRELDAEVARRSAALHAAGVRPGDSVLLVAARVPGLVPAVLACLRLGVAYVPVDPAAPDARWRTVAETVQAAAIVGPAAALVRAASALPDGLLRIDVDGPVPDAPAVEVHVDESATAYVLFTSGSTGTPKGVVVSHGNVAHRVASYLALTDGPCRYLLHSSLCFDGAVGGLFSTLARAGCLVLVPDDVAGDPGLAARAIREEGVTHLEPVPSWFTALLEVAEPGDLDPVRAVILGGEVLPPALVDATRRALPQVRLFNDYGPTEVTVAATVHEVPPAWSGAEVPIGAPHANTSVSVRDGNGRAVPAGDVGELWVAGPCVAQGYLRQPDHPAFGSDPVTGQRWYRTGDLVHRGPDGLLRFSGRIDRQVKIRGQRVEPEEVEAVLGGLPGVGRAAVDVDASGTEARLVAYVSPLPGTELAAEAVTRSLVELLPTHLRPGSVVVLPALPLTAGGKVDRAALPPLPRPAGSGGPRSAPAEGVERTVADAFAAVLDGQVDRETDFFTAGGQSLGAARVVARLRATLGVDVGLSDLAAHRTPEALAAVLRERPPTEPEAPLRRRPRPVDEVWRVPASERQESFWFLEHVPEGRGGSNLVELLAFPPGTSRESVAGAVDRLVRRHAALRTALELTPEGLVQVVHPRVEVPTVDLPPAQDTAALDGLADEFGAEPFDLGRAPLVRAGLTQGPEGPVLVLVVHHVVADGWSLNLVVEELAALVRADGPAAVLPRPEVEYADLVEWTGSRSSVRRAAALEHLTPLLVAAAEGAARMLPYDRPAPARHDPRGGLVTSRLPAETLRRVEILARRLGTTPYTVLSASLGALLAQSSGQQQVVLTGPISGRGDSALDRVVGCCINTRLIPVDVSGDPSFTDLVARVGARVAAGEPHEWLPLEVPMRALPEGVRTRVGPVLLNLLDPQGGDLTVGGSAVRRRGRPSAIAYNDLDLYLEHEDGGLAVQAVHSSARLDAGTVRDLLERWSRLLDAALDDPGQPVSALPLATPADDARLDVLEGDPGAPAVRSVLAEFRARAAEQPDAVAVIDGSGPWTRGELWHRSGAVAALLAARGAGPGATVVLALDGTADVLAALVGCWRAGAVPVPVGESQPGSRIEAVAGAAGAALVLDRRVLDALDPAASWQDAPDDAGSPAYVLFTSGSTGVPKGVVVSHAALAASTLARVAAYPDRPEVALVAHDLAFDAALGIVAWYLSTGGTLVMVSHDERLDPQLLAGLIRRHRVGQLDIVPSHHRLLLDLADPSDLASLALVTLGGEACPPSLVRAHTSVLPGAVLVNEYGPTECTVWALAHTCGEGDETADRVPVGRPVRGVVARVGNASGQRVPLGTEGELLLGGHLLADGYLGDPARTAERFVTRAGRRWYRTGDRVRWTADGEIDFLGRLDTQLKVRGFRIEPGEVEAALASLDGVVRAAVDAAEVVAGEQVLVGWVQLAPDAAVEERTPSRLREELLEDLPEWLVPTLLVVVDQMPETTAGKVDRGRLPRPEVRALADGSPPETPTEQQVAAVWEELLGRPVPVDQSFFALGGQSLLAARMVARLRAELGADIGLADVLAAPRVREVAALVDEALGERPDVIPTGDRAPVRGPALPDGPEALDLAQVEELLARVDDLADDEVEALLGRLGQP